jgi:hypothetical protein
MADLETIRAHVRALLLEYLGADELHLNDTGAVPIRAGSAAIYVHVVEDETPMVQLVSPVLAGVDASQDLYEALNRINAAIDVGRFFWEAGTVIAADNLVAETLDLIELSTACDGIADLADRYDDELQARFGGERSFPDA